MHSAYISMYRGMKNLAIKGLINLAMRGPQELQETAHMKSYRVDTSPKYAECLFQKIPWMSEMKAA